MIYIMLDKYKVSSYPVLTFAAFRNCSKLDVLALRSRLFEAVDSASEPESRSRNQKVLVG